ncbi:MAG: hypothetical protein ACRDNG_04570 [Gaiellaceae bacterium]
MRHHLLEQSPDGLDPGLRLYPVEQSGVVDVPGGQVGERPSAPVLELAKRRAPRPGGHGRMAAPERLKLGLLVCRDHELAGVKQPSLEASGGGTTDSSSGTSGTGSFGSSSSSGTSSSLPATGSEMLWLGLIGYGLIGYGLVTIGAVVRLGAIGR